jgi:hypothetical protein
MFFVRPSGCNITRRSGDCIRLDVSSTGSFPFPMSSNCRENISADWIVLQLDTHIRSQLQCTYVLLQCWIFEASLYFVRAGVDREITGNVRLKCPASIINAFPNGWTFPRKFRNDRSSASSDFFLCSIVPSSQTSLTYWIFCHLLETPELF